MTIYHVAKSGNDSNNGNSLATARLTIRAGSALLSPGDTLLVHVGTYTESLSPDQFTFPSGLSGAPITILANGNAALGTGELVTIDPAVAPNPNTQPPILGVFGGSYIIFDGFAVNGRQVINAVVAFEFGAHHCTVQNCHIFGSTSDRSSSGGAGVNTQQDCSFCTIKDNNIHDIGMNPYGVYGNLVHGIYLKGTNHILDGNIVRNNSGFGIHFNDGGGNVSNNIVRNNTVYANGLNTGMHGILIGSGSNNLCYNNLSYNGYGEGVRLRGGGTGNLIYNNTIYNNVGAGIHNFSETPNTIYRNNISYNNAGNTNNFQSDTTSYTQDHNLFGTDPLFTAPGSANFHLQPGSPAIGIGADLSSSFTVDIENKTRTVPWDVGAYRFGSSPALSNPGFWWAMEEGSGSILADQSLAGNPGVLTPGTGNVLPLWTTSNRLGKYGLSFNGAHEYVTMNTSYPLTVWSALFSFNASVAADGTRISHVFTLQFGNDAFGFHWDHLNASIRRCWFMYVNGATYAAQYITPLVQSTWYRLLCTFDGSNLRAYINGVLDVSASAIPPPASNIASSTYLAYPNIQSDSGLNAIIDEVILYPRVIDIVEIASDYNRTFNAPLKNPVNPMLMR